MNFFIRLFVLHFDRSFSGKGWRQLAWLFGVIVAVFSFIYLISFAYTFLEPTPEELAGNNGVVPMGRFFQLICLFIDPGNINNVPPSLRWFSLLVVTLGLVLFCGLLISVISNMLERRVERFREGDIVYPLSGHVVVIGFDRMVPALIQQICAEQEHGYILIQSICPAMEVRSKIHTELDSRNEKRIIILHGRRDSTEELEKLYSHKARKVFILGEQDEYDHDSLNIESLKKIVDIHKRHADCPLIPFMVLFEHQTTFAAFQLTDLSSEWRKYIQFHPFNFYEGWAKKLFISRQYDNMPEGSYPALDREPITVDSEKHVHLVIIGMSRMGIALGIEAAQLLHFPNYCENSQRKSVITFIDEAADREMNFFRGRYRHYFEVASSSFYDMSGAEERKQVLPPTRFKGTDADFLDVEFEFIKGRVESPLVQQKINEWADSGSMEILTIAVCLNYPPQSMAMGLYLPDAVYDNNIPVFIRQETSGSLLSMLNSKKSEDVIHKYSHVFPFGMLDCCYEFDHRNTHIAQAVNYIYWFYGHYEKLPEALPSEDELENLWNTLSVAHQWSNLYSAYSIGPKLRSLCITKDTVSCLTDKQIDLIAQVEHNRWNMEKLLLGFRKPTIDEELIIRSGKEKKDEYKNQRFVHPDIRPYNELSDGSKAFDRCITGGIPIVLEGTCIRIARS